MGIKLTQEEFDRRIQSLNNGIISIGQYSGYHTKIDFQCMYGHTWSATPSNVIDNHSYCPYCSGKKVLVGHNDLWTTRPDIAKLLKDKSDGYKYTKGSNKKVDFVCPECGIVNNKKIDMVCRYRFVCQSCSDGISYPNKFGRAFLDQLPIINHQCEYQPDWAKPFYYDNYFQYDEKEYIVEMDGLFHFEETTTTTISLEDRKRSDKIKDELAIKNNITIIRIDCRKSDCNYIKNNIINSELNNIFDLSCIDWMLCDQKAQKNLIKEVCNLYKSGIHNLYVIKDMLHISIWAVRKYVQDGSKFGWCDYTVEKSIREGREKIMTPINIIDDSGNIIHNFKSISICIKEMKEMYNVYLTSSNIIKSCQTNKPYKGFNFKYSGKNRSNNKIKI